MNDHFSQETLQQLEHFRKKSRPDQILRIIANFALMVLALYYAPQAATKFHVSDTAFMVGAAGFLVTANTITESRILVRLNVLMLSAIEYLVKFGK